MSDIKTSGYVTLHRANELEYPFMDTIRSLHNVVDEVVAVVTNQSNDGTLEALQLAKMAWTDKLVIHQVDLPDAPGWDGMLKEMGRAKCRGKAIIQMDADETFARHSEPQVKLLLADYERWGVKCLGSLQFDYVGSNTGKWATKWRFFVNDWSWKHGIPPSDQGPDGTAKVTDGCFPYDIETGNILPFPVPDWARPGFWPLVHHVSCKDVWLKMKRHRVIAPLWDRLRPDGWSQEANSYGPVEGKSDEELRDLADFWLSQQKGLVPSPDIE